MGRADIPLKTITWWLIAVYVAWFIITIVMHSLNNASGIEVGPGGTLNLITQNHFYHYGAEGVMTFFVVFACWLAAYQQTRQLRALALVATTWGVFAWFIYLKWTLSALDPAFDCGSPLATATTRWCGVSIASGVMSVLLELGKVLLWGWAIYRFIQLRNCEPFCELDKSEIEFEQKKQAGMVQQNNLAPLQGTINQPNQPSSVPMQNLQTSANPVHVQSTPVGLIESEAPMSTAGNKITALNQQKLSLPSFTVLFFIGLTIIGWIITTLACIQIFRYDYQDDNVNQGFGTIPRTGGFGDQNLLFNLFFPALTLLFSLSFGAMAAYDRLRDNTVSPLFLNIITAMQLWGLVIYTLRRADHDPADGTTGVAWSAQLAQAAGFGIMAFSETLRIGAMTWKVLTMAPAVHPYKPAVSNHVGSWLYWFTQALMFSIAFAWLIVLIVLCSIGTIFDVVGPTYATGLPYEQAALQYAYHNFVISLMIMALMFAGNMYINIAGTRTAVMAGYTAQLFCIGIWWLTCWNMTHAALTSSGFLYETFCRDGMSSNVCNLTRASGILGILMFSTFVVNTLVSLWRLVLVDIAAKSALPAAELQRQGTTLTRREALARGTVGFGDTWISAELFFWIAMAGWLIYAFGSTEFNKTAYYTVTDGGPLREPLAFEIFQLVSVHFLSVAGLLCMFIQAHIITNKTYRDHSHEWRYAQFAAFFFQFAFSIPMLILFGRYTHLYDLDSSHLAALAGLSIFVIGEFCQTVQMGVYSLIYPAQPVTVLLPTTGMQYDKAGNPVLGAIPLDVEKGETLNPHHDQAGLGTNYTKTDYRHQDAGGLVNAALTTLGVGGSSQEKDSRNMRDNDMRHENPTAIGSGMSERDTAIPQQQQQQV